MGVLVSALQACNRQSIYCVPLYDSLGENAVEYIINHSESSILFVSKEKLDTVIQALPKAHKGLKTLVYWGTHDQNHAGVDAVSFMQGNAAGFHANASSKAVLLSVTLGVLAWAASCAHAGGSCDGQP